MTFRGPLPCYCPSSSSLINQSLLLLQVLTPHGARPPRSPCHRDPPPSHRQPTGQTRASAWNRHHAHVSRANMKPFIKHSLTPLSSPHPRFSETTYFQVFCVHHHYSRPFLNKPSVRALFSFPWCEQISSQGPCTTDNGPMLHLASGITTHLASIRYRSQISAWMNWIHIPSVCTGKWCESPEVVITDISIIHGHRSTEDCTSIKRVSFECVSGFKPLQCAVDEVWLPLPAK